MARQNITIDSIFEGIQPSFHFGQKNQFLASIGIDPDLPLSDTATDIKTSGVLRPSMYEKFSDSDVDSAPIAIITTPKDSYVYVVLANGKLVRYDSDLTNETLIGTVTGGVAKGACYYNNYIYIFTGTDVSRYGPLDNSPSLANTFWTSTLSLTALTNTTYPSTRHSLTYLNHFAFTHVDNALYFCNYANGIGYLNKIITSKNTDEGDTNNGSAANVLDLPFNHLPVVGSSYGNDVVVATTMSASSTLRQGPAKLFFWDTTSTSFYRVIELPDPICTWLGYINGTLWGISGDLAGGVRLWRYLGGNTVQTVKFIEEGHPPMQYAVANIGNRIAWGAFTTYPDNSAGLFAYGSKSDLFPRGLHHIARSSLTATASNGLITAVAAAQQGFREPKFLMGGTDGTNTNIDKKSTTYGTHYFRTRVFNVGHSFEVSKITLRLGAAVAANMTITPKLFFDNESSSQAGTVINSTNYANSERYITLTPDDFSKKTYGSNNFYLELKWTGTALLPILLPIEIEVDVEENKLT